MAGNESLVYQLELKLDKATGELDSFVARSKAQAGAAGKGAGQAFGSSFSSIVNTILGAISFNKLLGVVQGALGAFKSLQVANVQLAGSVRFVNSEMTRTNTVLASTTSSYEQKAAALGLDSDKLYVNTKATQSNVGAIKSQEKFIKDAERAFQDKIKAQEQSITSLEKETKTIDKQIQAIQKQTNEKVKQLRIERGANTLDIELRTLEIQKNQFEIQRDQAILAGDGALYAEAMNQISVLNVEISLRQNKLDAIEFEIDAIKEQGKAQEDVYRSQKEILEAQIFEIRSELSAAKNKFDIDIEPAKRKLEDLRDTNVSIGGGKALSGEAKKFIDKMSEEARNNPPNLISPEAIEAATREVKDRFKVKGRDVISDTSIKQALGDVFKSGITDVKQASDLVGRFIESATLGRSAGVELETAITNLSYAFRTSNSQIGNASGIAENFEDINRDGTRALKEQYLAMGDIEGARRIDLGLLTEQEKAQARYLGIQQVTEDTLGEFGKLAETGALDTLIFTQQIKELQRAIGKELLPKLIKIVPIVASLLDKVVEFVAENPEVITNLLLLATAFTGIFTAGGILMPILGAVASAIGFITTPVGIAVLAIGGLIGLFKSLYDNSETFRAVVDGALSQVQNKFKTILEYFNTSVKPEFKRIFDSIVTIFEALAPVIRPFIDNFVTFFTNTVDNIAKVVGGLVKTISGALELIAGVLTGDGAKIRQGFEKIFSGLGDMAKGFLNQVIDKINSFLENFNAIGDKVSDATGGKVKVAGLPKIPRLAKGGLVSGAGTGTSDSIPALLSNGEFVVNAKSAKKFFPILQALNRGVGVTNQTDNRQINSGNSTVYEYKYQYVKPDYSNLAYNY